MAKLHAAAFTKFVPQTEALQTLVTGAMADFSLEAQLEQC
jgi:hypothetical protein